VVAHIRAQGHGCCLVGGLAVTLRVRERATKDIDLAVAVGSDREAEQLAGSLIRAGYPVTHVLEQTERGGSRRSDSPCPKAPGIRNSTCCSTRAASSPRSSPLLTRSRWRACRRCRLLASNT
jgi:hypothetical protein